MADVVDVIEDSPPAVDRKPLPTREELRGHLEAHLKGRDLAGLSLKGLRRELEQRLGLPEGGLDSQRDELKALAQAYAQAATAKAGAPASAPAPAAAATAGGAPPPQRSPPQSEPPAKRQKSLLVSGGGIAAGGPPALQPTAAAGAAPAALVAAPPAKAAAKRGPMISAYSMWCNDNRARISQELVASRNGEKPSFGEVCKAVSEAWKQVPAEDRAPYEQKAATAKAEAAASEPQQPKAPKAQKAPKEPKPGKGGGKGRGRGGKGAAAADAGGALTRAEFLRAGQKLRCNLSLEGASLEEPGKALQSFALSPRVFKSGTTGWFQMAAMTVPVDGREITVKAQLNVMVSGSKHWLDGEDLPAGAGDAVAPDGPVDLEAVESDASEPLPGQAADAPTPKGGMVANAAAEVAAAAAVALDEGTDNAAAHAGA